VLSFAALLVVWQVAVRVLDVSPYIAKTPTDVWHYVFLDSPNSTAVEHRSQLSRLLGVTLRDAGIGFLSGVISSVHSRWYSPWPGPWKRCSCRWRC